MWKGYYHKIKLMKTLNSNIPESAKILTAALSNQEDLLNLV